MPSRLLIALLSASLSLTAAAVVQLLPSGQFSARDGRPGPGKSWTLTDAQGRPASEVVQLVHELTGAPAELPVSQVLATGEVHLLANHTLLVARDGSRLPIADSAAPIRDSEGRVHGVVMVFRDETLARQAKRSIREQNARLEQRVQERTAQLTTPKTTCWASSTTCPR